MSVSFSLPEFQMALDRFAHHAVGSLSKFKLYFALGGSQQKIDEMAKKLIIRSGGVVYQEILRFKDYSFKNIILETDKKELGRSLFLFIKYESVIDKVAMDFDRLLSE